MPSRRKTKSSKKLARRMPRLWRASMRSGSSRRSGRIISCLVTSCHIMSHSRHCAYSHSHAAFGPRAPTRYTRLEAATLRKMADQTAKAAAREVDFSRRSFMESEANTNLQREVEHVKTEYGNLQHQCWDSEQRNADWIINFKNRPCHSTISHNFTPMLRNVISM